MNDRVLLRIVLWELRIIKSDAEHLKCLDLHYDDLISDLDSVIGKIKNHLYRPSLNKKNDKMLTEKQENKQDNNNDF